MKKLPVLLIFIPGIVPNDSIAKALSSADFHRSGHPCDVTDVAELREEGTVLTQNKNHGGREAQSFFSP